MPVPMRHQLAAGIASGWIVLHRLMSVIQTLVRPHPPLAQADVHAKALVNYVDAQTSGPGHGLDMRLPFLRRWAWDDLNPPGAHDA